MGQPIGLLNLRWARRRPLRTTIAVLSVAAGVSLVASVVVIQQSTAKSFEGFGRSFAGPAPLRVIGPGSRGGLAASTLEQVERVDGVRAAIPVIQAVTMANAAGGDDLYIIGLGFDCRMEALIGEVGCHDDSISDAPLDAPPILSSSLARQLGADGVIRTNQGPRPAQGGLVLDALDDVNVGRVAAYPLPVAQHLFTRPDALDAIYVLPTADADIGELQAKLRTAVGSHNGVLRSTDPPPGTSLFMLLIVGLLGLVSLFALAIGGILARNAMTLALEERRRDLAIAGALGATPRTLLGAMLIEAGGLGLVGGAVGSMAGYALAHPIAAGMEVFASRTTGLRITVHAGWLPFLLAILLGGALSVVSAIRPARRAARLDVVSELGGRVSSEDTKTGSLWRVGALFGITAIAVVTIKLAQRGGALSSWQALVGQAAFLVAVVALFAGLAGSTPWLFHLGRRLVPGGALVRLAWANLLREPRRTTVMVLATGAAIASGVSIAAITVSTRDGIAAGVSGEIGDRIAVSTMPSSNTLNLDARPSPALEADLENFPGVAAVHRNFGMGVGTSNEEFIGVGAAEDQAFPYEVFVGRADPDALQRGEVLIGPALARLRGIRPPSTIRVPGRDRFYELPVQGVWANGDYNGREITMPTWLLEQMYGPQAPIVLRVEPAPGVDPDDLARRIEDAELDPFLQALAPSDQLADVEREAEGFVQPFWALQRGMLFVAFAAVLFTLLLMAVQRRRELGLLAAVGLAPTGLARLVLTEALAVAVVGTIVGMAGSLVVVEAFRSVAFLVIPFRVPFRFDLAAPVVYGALTAAILVAAASWPAWRTSRLQVVDAIRYE